MAIFYFGTLNSNFHWCLRHQGKLSPHSCTNAINQPND